MHFIFIMNLNGFNKYINKCPYSTTKYCIGETLIMAVPTHTVSPHIP